jgi:transaldolase
MPPETIEAFRDHGRVANTLEQDVDEARLILDNLAELQIDLEEVTEQLQVDGVEAFANSFDALMETIAEKKARLA